MILYINRHQTRSRVVNPDVRIFIPTPIYTPIYLTQIYLTPIYLTPIYLTQIYTRSRRHPPTRRDPYSRSSVASPPLTPPPPPLRPGPRRAPDAAGLDRRGCALALLSSFLSAPCVPHERRDPSGIAAHGRHALPYVARNRSRTRSGSHGANKPVAALRPGKRAAVCTGSGLPGSLRGRRACRRRNPPAPGLINLNLNLNLDGGSLF